MALPDPNPSVMTICPGCHLQLPKNPLPIPGVHTSSPECHALYGDVSAQMLHTPALDYPHQYLVDAYAAQHPGPHTKPITIVFALMGLYLSIERGYTGKAVQRFHMRIPKRPWEDLTPPDKVAEMTILDVWKDRTSENLLPTLRKWSACIWDNWENQHEFIRQTTRAFLPG